MKHKKSAVRIYLAAIVALFACAMLALGVWFAVPRSALAEENTNLDGAVITILKSDERANIFYYTGSEIKPEVEVKLGNDTVDPLYYDVTLSNAREPGIATVSIYGKNGYSGTASTHFSILYKNEWVKVPSIIEWTRGKYKIDVNVITAEANYGTDTVLFSIYYGDTTPVTYPGHNDIRFSLDENGLVPDYVSRKLSALEVGTYYIVGHIASSATYSGINDFGEMTASEVGNVFYVDAPAGSWKTPPAIVPWTWQRFNREVNTITCVPAEKPQDYTQITYGVYTLPNYNDGFAVKGLESFTTVGGSNVDGMVDMETGKKLAELPVGTYYLRVHVAYENSEHNMDTFTSFRVLQIQNYWKQTPKLVEWAWNEYDPAVNTLTAIPNFTEEGAEVTFGVYTDAACYDIDAVENLALFTEVGPMQAKALASLNVGTYYLKASFPETLNYSKLETAISFTVRENENAWTTSPYVLSWNYGTYNKEVNKIFAEAKFGTPVFSVYCGTGGDVSTMNALEFSQAYEEDNTKFVLSDGLVPEYVKEKLQTLEAGGYYLVVTCEGSANYSGLDVQSVPFVVQGAENAWVTAPGMEGWREGNFDERVNTIAGTAKFGGVTFGIYNNVGKLLYTIRTENGKVISVADADGKTVELNALNGLKVGSYVIKAEVEGTGNYSSLSTTAAFAVFEDSVGLTGVITAAIIFAGLDVFAAAVCITLLVIRRKRVEEQFRELVRKELGRR